MAIADCHGLPIALWVTSASPHEQKLVETTLEHRFVADKPKRLIGDKGYDSDANRRAARARGITPVIPRRENSKQRGRFFPKRLYKLRARIEQTIGKLKRFKRVAIRCEKTDISYSAIISFACGLMLVESVHTA